MRRLASVQKLLSTHATLYNTFNVRCRVASAQTHREVRAYFVLFDNVTAPA
jgi:hypothetical protein